MVVHPGFKFSPAADRFDVAVLQLSSPVSYMSHIAPICLPQVGRDPEPGTIAYAAGWGAIIPDDQLGPLAFLIPKEQKRPKVLQVVDVPLIQNAECEVWHERAGITVKLCPEMMCAGYRDGGKDSCKGDSGGPLMVRQRDGRWICFGWFGVSRVLLWQTWSTRNLSQNICHLRLDLIPGKWGPLKKQI